jgi:hypothetical protein
LRADPSAESYAKLLESARDHAQSCIDAAFDYSKQRWDQSHVPSPIKPGDRVLISTKHFALDGPRKLHEASAGPFSVVRLIGDNAIEVALTGEYARKHPVFPVSLAKPYTAGDPARFPGRRQAPPPDPDFIDGEPEWEIEQILDEKRLRSANGTLERHYLVRWKGYDSSHDEFVPESELSHAQELLRAFRASRRSRHP